MGGLWHRFTLNRTYFHMFRVYRCFTARLTMANVYRGHSWKRLFGPEDQPWYGSTSGTNTAANWRSLVVACSTSNLGAHIIRPWCIVLIWGSQVCRFSGLKDIMAKDRITSWHLFSRAPKLWNADSIIFPSQKSLRFTRKTSAQGWTQGPARRGWSRWGKNYIDWTGVDIDLYIYTYVYVFVYILCIWILYIHIIELL